MLDQISPNIEALASANGAINNNNSLGNGDDTNSSSSALIMAIATNKRHNQPQSHLPSNHHLISSNISPNISSLIKPTTNDVGSLQLYNNNTPIMNSHSKSNSSGNGSPQSNGSPTACTSITNTGGGRFKNYHHQNQHHGHQQYIPDRFRSNGGRHSAAIVIAGQSTITNNIGTPQHHQQLFNNSIDNALAISRLDDIHAFVEQEQRRRENRQSHLQHWKDFAKKLGGQIKSLSIGGLTAVDQVVIDLLLKYCVTLDELRINNEIDILSYLTIIKHTVKKIYINCEHGIGKYGSD